LFPEAALCNVLIQTCTRWS